MKIGLRIVVPLLAASVIGAGFFAFGSLDPTGALASDGVLTVEPSVVSIGRAAGRDHQERVTFVLKNIGGKRLRIGEVEASCGCTVADPLVTSLLEPGEQVSLNVKATPPAFGEKLARLLIHTNSQQTPRVAVGLHLKGDILDTPFTTLWPPEVPVQGNRPGGLKECELRLRTMEARDSSPWLRSLTADPPPAHVRLVEMTEARGLTEVSVARMYRFRVQVPIPAAEDENATVRLVPEFSRDAQRIPVSIRMVVSLTAPVRVLPREVFVLSSAGEENSSIERTIVVLASSQEDFVVDVESPKDEWIEVAEVQPSKGRTEQSVRIRLKLNCSASVPGALRSTLVVRTNYPGYERLEMPVTVFYRSETSR